MYSGKGLSKVVRKNREQNKRTGKKKKEFAENRHNLRHTQKNPEIYYQYSEAREDIIVMKKNQHKNKHF